MLKVEKKTPLTALALNKLAMQNLNKEILTKRIDGRDCCILRIINKKRISFSNNTYWLPKPRLGREAKKIPGIIGIFLSSVGLDLCICRK